MNWLANIVSRIISSIIAHKIIHRKGRPSDTLPLRPDLSDPRIAGMWEYLNAHSTSLPDYPKYVDILKGLGADDVTALFRIRDLLEPDHSAPKTIDIERRLHDLKLISPLPTYGGAERYGISEDIGRCFLCACGVPMRHIDTKEVIYPVRCTGDCPIRKA